MDLDALMQRLAQLEAQVGGKPLDFRSRPHPKRQLDDLRLMPTADDPRPSFFMSAETPRGWDTSKPGPYAQLMWNRDTGDEITVHSEAERAAHADAYTTDPPMNRIVTQAQAVADLLASLSPEDRMAVIKAQQARRLEAASAAMAGLTDDQLDAVLKSMPQPAVQGRKTA